MKKYIKRLYLILIILIIFGSTSVISAVNNNLSFKYNCKLKHITPSKEINLKRKDLSLPEFHVRGIYVNGWVAGIPHKMEQLMGLIKNSILNTMVINIKDDQGYLSYNSKVELAQEISANRNKIKDIKKLLTSLHNNGIYTIARIVVFKDSLLARKRPEFALTYWKPKKNKIIFSKKWVDPEEMDIWDYNIRLAREALKMGFDEVQFDYIRFPAMSASKSSRIILDDQLTKSDVINNFALAAQKRLADLSKPVSVDVFGLTTATDDGLGIGQNFLELSEIVDIISPMIYPSHYAPGSYGIEIPAENPYKLINRSMIDARKKVLGRKEVIIRPWLQDFSLKHNYTVRDVKEQIKAVEDLGIKEWLLWNSRSQYSKEVFLKPSIQ